MEETPRWGWRCRGTCAWYIQALPILQHGAGWCFGKAVAPRALPWPGSQLGQGWGSHRGEPLALSCLLRKSFVVAPLPVLCEVWPRVFLW